MKIILNSESNTAKKQEVGELTLTELSRICVNGRKRENKSIKCNRLPKKIPIKI